MIKKIRKIIKKLEESPFDIRTWILSFLGIVFIRGILESFSNRSWDGSLFSFQSFFIHFPLYYMAVVLSFILVFRIFTGERIDKISRIVLCFLPVVWLAPVFDLLMTGGRGWQMTYLFAYPGPLLADFFSFFGPLYNPGVSPGIRLEIMLILAGSGIYVYSKTRSLLKSLSASFSLYFALFIYAALPSLLAILAQGSRAGNDFISRFFTGNFYSRGTILSRTMFAEDWFETGFFGSALPRSFQKLFDVEMSQVYLIIVVILLGIWLYFYGAEKFRAVAKNIRPLRAANYLAMMALGLYMGYSAGGRWLEFSFFDLSSILLVALSVLFAWMAAVSYNDIADLDCDRVSSPDRPIVRGIVSIGESRAMFFVFSVLSLLSAGLAGYYFLVFMLVYHADSYVYSAKPLKLKRFPIVSRGLIALSSLMCAFCGFFLLSGTGDFRAFPPNIALTIAVFYVLVSNIIDIKDIKGDKAAGVRTIPVIFGDRRGKMIISAMVAAALLLVPCFLADSRLTLASLPFAAWSAYLINRKNYRERPLFISLFAYLAVIFIILIAS